MRHCCAAMRTTGGCAFRSAGGRRAVFSGAAQKAGEIPPPGGARENPSATVQPFSPQHEAALHLAGIRVFWMPDRHGVPRVMRRTARKKLQAACQRLTAWIKHHRHLPGRACFQRLNARLAGPRQLLTACEGTPARSTAFSIGRWTVRSNGSIGGEASGAVTPGSSLPGSSTASR